MAVEHSKAEEMLKGTQYLAEGSEKFGHEIKSITKPSAGKRVITFKDGSKINTNKQTVRALVDVKLDKQYKPKALATLKGTKAGTAKVKLGGPKEGDVVKYASKANAKRAVDNYYSGDFQQYKKGIYPQRCKKK